MSNLPRGFKTGIAVAGSATVGGDTITTNSASQTLLNKTIDADSNTITNIDNADIKVGAAIDASKIADGSVSNAEFQYINSLTSNAQDQLDAKIPLTQKGANNGVATLDAGGKIPASQLPNSVMEYLGTWNASTNTPTLADGTGNAGDVYLVNVAGTQNLGSGPISFAVGDWVVYSGSIWEKSINSNSVVSVNGQTGVVSLTTSDISEGSNLYYTDERAQDAVGTILVDSSKIDLTYNDATPSISATIVAGSLVNADINASAAIDASKLADGSVSNTEFQYLNGVTSPIQTQLDGKATTSLNNLSSTSLNADIVPNSDNTKSLGSSVNNFANVHSKIVQSNSTFDILALNGNLSLSTDAYYLNLITNGGFITFFDNAATPPNPGDVWTSLGSDGTGYWAPATGGANQQLSNLSNTAINEDLRPADDDSINLGFATKRFWQIFVEEIQDDLNELRASFYNDKTLLRISDSNASIDFEVGNGGGTGAIKAKANQGIRFHDAGTSNYIGLRATGLSGSTTFNLPTADGTNGQYLKTNGSGQLSFGSIGSLGDIAQTSFSMSNNQASPANVTGLAFANGTVRSFDALVSVSVNASTNSFETFKLLGIQRDADWQLSYESTGDNSGIVFSITNSGQIQYTTPNYAGFVAAACKFRAVVTNT